MEVKKEKFLNIINNKKIVLCLLLAIMIIILLLYRFITFYDGKNYNRIPTGNVDVFEINCNDNCDCISNFEINNLDNDSYLSNLSISSGNLTFDKNIKNYNILVENNITKITLNATKNNDKSTLYYIYKNRIYTSFNDIPISVGENIITIVVIAENGSLSSYRIILKRLDEKSEVVTPEVKDSNTFLSNITISDGNLKFEKNTKNYQVQVDNNINKITLNAIPESEKSTVYYIYNGKYYSEFKDIDISDRNNIITIVVTAEDGTTNNYVVNVVKKMNDLAYLDELEWYSKNTLNIFSNPAYENKAVLAPGSSNSYEFVIKNKVNRKVKYKLEFLEDSEYKINMRYRLKRNGKYIVGNEDEWVNTDDINLMEIEVDYGKEDDYTLDWKWFDGENDNLIGKLQNDYSLRITLSATTLK